MSLKYRIAVIIFALEAVMMAFVLSATLNHSTDANRDQLATFENVITNVLAQLSRIALFTAEYDELQPYIEEVVKDPHVIRIIVADSDDRIVVSSDLTLLGEAMPQLLNQSSQFWLSKEISNASGDLGRIAINFSHDDLMKANSEAMDLGVAIALTGMAVIAVVGFVIGFLMTRNLEHLTEAATRMSEGNLDARSGLQGSDEISMVGRVFDHMADNIRRYVEDLRLRETQIKQANDELEQRIRERTQELAIARDQALEASRTKSAFLANMSHELRTPLNAIIGYTDILCEEVVDIGHQELTPDLKNIRNSGAHLLSLINDVLDLSKIEAGKIEFHIDHFSIESLVQDALVTVQPLAEKNHNLLQPGVATDIGVMLGDEIKIRQMLINLLSNASKFTENGNIQLRVEAAELNGQAWVNFFVRDTGIGIPEDKIDQLFNEFSQVDASATRRYQGTGLGLAITYKFCLMMGGDISVRSEVGKGSEFCLSLPREMRHPKQLVEIEENSTATDAYSKRFTGSDDEPAPALERRSRIASILVIDDDPHMVNMLQRMLGRHGFSVVYAQSGYEGLEYARDHRPDVIILDIMLPDIDGWKVMRSLKSEQSVAAIPIVVVSLTHDEQTALSNGASHVVSKPVDWHRLVDVLQQCLRN